MIGERTLRARPPGRRAAPAIVLPAWTRTYRAPLAVAAIVAAAATVTILYCLKLAGYFVMPDELGYVQQAHFIAEHLRPVLPHDAQFGSWSQLEPVVLAIPYGLFDTPTAFDVAHAINAVILASAAIPAYLLMRRLHPWRGAAYLVAAMTVAVPWMTLAGTMLTENVAYPAFMWAVLAAHSAITRAGPRRDVMLIVALGVAYAARTQLSLLAAAAAVGIVAHEVGWRWRGEPGRPPGRALLEGVAAAIRGHLVLLGAVVVGLAVILSSTSGQLLGGYAAPTQGALLPPGTVASAREILAQVVVGIGVLPLALAFAFALGSLWRPRDADAQAYAALAIPTVVLMALALGSFSVRFTAGVNDRYLFFLAPVLFCGTVAFLLERRRWLVPLGLGLAGATVLVASATLSQRGPSLVSPAAAFHDVLAKVGIGGVPTTSAVLGGAATAAVALARVLDSDRRRQAFVAGTALLAFLAVETVYTIQKVADGQHVSAQYLAGRNWVDRRLPAGQDAAVLLSNFFGDRNASAATWWDLTFWNVEVDRALRFASADDFIQKTTFPLDIDERTGALEGIGSRYLIVADTEQRLALTGAVPVAGQYGMHLMRLPARPRAAWAVLGTDPAGHLPPGGVATVMAFTHAPGGFVLRLSAQDAPRGYRVRVGGRTLRLRKGAKRTVRVPARPGAHGGPETVRLAVAGPPASDPVADPGPAVVVARVPGG